MGKTKSSFFFITLLSTAVIIFSIFIISRTTSSKKPVFNSSEAYECDPCYGDSPFCVDSKTKAYCNGSCWAYTTCSGCCNSGSCGSCPAVTATPKPTQCNTQGLPEAGTVSCPGNDDKNRCAKVEIKGSNVTTCWDSDAAPKPCGAKFYCCPVKYEWVHRGKTCCYNDAANGGVSYVYYIRNSSMPSGYESACCSNPVTGSYPYKCPQ